MDSERLARIRKLAIIALVSDDELMDSLVLKGGNAIALIHGITARESLDLDFSLETDFPDPDCDALRRRFEGLLVRTFAEEGYAVFDVRVSPEPPHLTPDMADFWGGYRLEFKVIQSSKIPTAGRNLESLRRRAEVVGPRQRRTFRIDISKFEYSQPKEEKQIEGYSVFVYTPAMLVCEKLRAICQQTPEYREIVRSRGASARARDFFDIHGLVERFRIDLASRDNTALLRAMFAAKRVPLHLLGHIAEYREYHRADFPALEATVAPAARLKGFDFYFDYVLALVAKLEPLWDV